MLEICRSDIPPTKTGDLRRLDLGHCPHGHPMFKRDQGQSYTEAPFINWTYTKSLCKQTSNETQDLRVPVTVQILWGIASGKVDYKKHDSTSQKKMSLQVESRCVVRKGSKVFEKGSRSTTVCSECEQQKYYLQTIILGAEAQLTIQLEFDGHDESHSQTLKASAKLFGVSVGEGLKNFFESNRNVRCTFKIKYMSTLNPENNRDLVRSRNELDLVLTEVESLEKIMSSFPKLVAECSINTASLCYKYNFASMVDQELPTYFNCISNRICALCFFDSCLDEIRWVHQEVSYYIENRQMQSQKLKELVSQLNDKLQRLEQMQNTCFSRDDVRRVYGNHASNYYRRELQRIVGSS